MDQLSIPKRARLYLLFLAGFIPASRYSPQLLNTLSNRIGKRWNTRKLSKLVERASSFLIYATSHVLHPSCWHHLSAAPFGMLLYFTSETSTTETFKCVLLNKYQEMGAWNQAIVTSTTNNNYVQYARKHKQYNWSSLIMCILINK